MELMNPGQKDMLFVLSEKKPKPRLDKRKPYALAHRFYLRQEQHHPVMVLIRKRRETIGNSDTIDTHEPLT